MCNIHICVIIDATACRIQHMLEGWFLGNIEFHLKYIIFCRDFLYFLIYYKFLRKSFKKLVLEFSKTVLALVS